MERMSWLSKLHPRGGGPRAPRSASLQPPVTADPETCLMVFKNHWAQVLRILERRGCKPAPDDLSAVRNHTYQMLSLLAEERPRHGAEAAARGPILDFVASENLLERLLCWHLQGEFGEERKVEQLKLYEMLISQARQPLLRHRPVLAPLLRLLGLCAGPASAPLGNSLVLLLNQLCVSVAKEPSILELFFHSQAEQGPANLIIFSLLIPFIHHEGVLGQRARDALLLIMAMSATNHAVAKSITDNSYFCPVLATGLSALYSSLPRKIEVRGDDWHCLRREDWIGVSSLVLFMNSLEFCNAVIQVAHPLVQKQLVDYVHNGFLVPVMGPALHKSSVEEMIASTAYLELFLRSVSEAALLKTFLRFVLLHRHDSSTILDTLVARINSTSRLCMVSLSLFRTLLSLNCEDVMLQLVLRYLLPCSHVMLSQRRAVRELDIYGRTAAKFLSLTPRCCRPQSPPRPPEREEEQPAWARGSPGADAPSAAPKPSTPSRLSFFLRQPSNPPAAAEGPGPAPRSPGTPAGSPRGGGRWEELRELDRNYLEYLRDARRSIDRCAWACRVWSAPYDGQQPTPQPPPTDYKAGSAGGGGQRGAGGLPERRAPRGGSRRSPPGRGGPGERRPPASAAPAGGRGAEEGSAGAGGLPGAGAERGRGPPAPRPRLGAAGVAAGGAAGPGARRAQRRRRHHRDLHPGAAGHRGRDEERGGPGSPPAAPRAAPGPPGGGGGRGGGGGGGGGRGLRCPGRGGGRPGAPAAARPPGPAGDQPAAGGGAPPQPALHRPVRVGAAGEAGEHAAQLALRQLPADGAGGPAGLLPPAPAALLPAQHQHGLPAQRQVPAAGAGLGEEQDRELCCQPGGFPSAAAQGQEVPDRPGEAGRGGHAGGAALPAPLRRPGAEPEAVAGGAAPAPRQQPHARAPRAPPGPAPGAGRGAAAPAGGSRGAAGRGPARPERRVLRRHLQRVPQGAGGHRPGTRRHLPLPHPAPRGLTRPPRRLFSLPPAPQPPPDPPPHPQDMDLFNLLGTDGRTDRRTLG